MKTPRFDFPKFCEDLDRIRQQRNLIWRQVAHQAGITTTSTLSRLRNGAGIDAHAIAALCLWADLSANDYFIKQQP